MGRISHFALIRDKDPYALIGMDLDLSDQATLSVYAERETGKSTRLTLPRSLRQSEQYLDLVRSDLIGPMQTSTIQSISARDLE